MPENELFVLCLGTVVLAFIVFYHQNLNRLPAQKWLFSSFFALWVAWIATLLEHISYPTLFNVIEHIGYALNGILLCAWCWIVKRKGTVHAHD